MTAPPPTTQWDSRTTSSPRTAQGWTMLCAPMWTFFPIFAPAWTMANWPMRACSGIGISTMAVQAMLLIDYLFLLAYTTRREAMIATVRTTARIHSPEPRSQSFPPPWASGMSLSSTKNWCAFVSLA